METFKECLKLFFDIGMYLNILAMLPQPIKMLRSGKSEDVSAWMWLMFFTFQTATSLHGLININSMSMFFGMGGSALISLFVLVLKLIPKKVKQTNSPT